MDWYSAGVDAMRSGLGGGPSRSAPPAFAKSAFNEPSAFAQRSALGRTSFNSSSPFGSSRSTNPFARGYKSTIGYNGGNPLADWDARANARMQEQFGQQQQVPGFGQSWSGGSVGGQFTNVSAIAGGNLANAANYINQSAAQNGIPANLLAAFIARESTGDWNRDGSRYVYLPDRGHYILPYAGMTDPAIRRVGMDPRSLIGNQAGQIEAAARLIRQVADNEAKGYGWEGVANVFYSGDPTGSSTPGDSWQYGSTNSYTRDIMNFWNILEPGGPNAPFNGGQGSPGGATGQAYDINGIWGGGQYSITQEHGPSHFSLNVRPEWYTYAKGVGVNGHPGIDVGMPDGTMLYSPVNGTVIAAGGTGSYYDRRGDGPGRGELRIQTDSGDIVILGHTSAITVRAGQRITAGTPVARSGDMNGPHLHLEVRVPGSTSSGWQAVDPRQYFQGMSFQYGNTMTNPAAGAPMQAPRSSNWWMNSLNTIFGA